MAVSLAFDALLLVCLAMASNSTAQNWSQSTAPQRRWSSVVSSADGHKLAAACGGLLTSTNTGLTWEEQTTPGTELEGLLFFLASSADGNRLVATSYDSIYTSTNAGVTWTSNNLPRITWTAVASSSDGNKLVAVAGEKVGPAFPPYLSGPIYTSTNAGATWTMTSAPSNYWNSVASSADGERLVAAAHALGSCGDCGGDDFWNPGGIYISTNSGGNWFLADAPKNASIHWEYVASSSDGRVLLASSLGPEGLLYSSTNSGASWTSNDVPIASWQGVAVSADGCTMVAVSWSPGFIYSSTNAGRSWTSNSAPAATWSAVAASADGGSLIAATYIDLNGRIYTSRTTQRPRLHLEKSTEDLLLSWGIPSAGFRLEECPDTAINNWSAATNQPRLDSSGLRYQVALPVQTGEHFYRLKSAD